MIFEHSKRVVSTSAVYTVRGGGGVRERVRESENAVIRERESVKAVHSVNCR